MARTIVVNNKSYRLETVTGKVLAPTKSMQTTVQASASGGGGRLHHGSGKVQDVDLTVTSTTIVHDQFFLQDDAGRERSFQLQGFNVACREGNVLSVVAAFQLGQPRGPYVAVYNGTTQTRFYNEQALKELCRPSSLLYFLGCLGAMLVEYQLLSGFLLVAGGLFITAFGTLVAYYIKTDNVIQAFKSKL